jgi:uncharacterized protein
MAPRRSLTFVRAGLAASVLALSIFGGVRFAPRFLVGSSARAENSVSDVADPAGLEPLVIDTATGPHQFSVELARTEEEREKGLMFRRSLPPDRGMIFDFKTAQPVMMWMKNTYIPLDMIFMAQDGRVTHIAEDEEPLSEKIIPSDGPAFAVLEVNAGTAKRIGLKPGDKVQNALFGD